MGRKKKKAEMVYDRLLCTCGYNFYNKDRSLGLFETHEVGDAYRVPHLVLGVISKLEEYEFLDATRTCKNHTLNPLITAHYEAYDDDVIELIVKHSFINEEGVFKLLLVAKEWLLEHGQLPPVQ